MKAGLISPRVAAVTLILCLSLLCVSGTPVARADDSSRAAKIAELMKLTGVAQIVAESNVAGRAVARKTVQSMTDSMLAQFPEIPPDKRARIEGAAQQFLRDVDMGFDQDDAARAWGRFYSESLTETELDAILTYYQSPVGQKDVSASRAALPQFQHYMLEQRRAVLNAAVANYTAALRNITGSSAAGGAQAGPAKPGPIPEAATAGAAMPEESPVRPWDSNPSAPNGSVLPNPSASERCEVTQAVAPGAHAVPPSGRSVVCVCTDEKGTLIGDPVIAESSGDSRVDSGAVKMARSDSGRYKPPTRGGQPQKACFRYAIDFKHRE